VRICSNVFRRFIHFRYECLRNVHQRCVFCTFSSADAVLCIALGAGRGVGHWLVREDAIIVLSGSMPYRAVVTTELFATRFDLAFEPYPTTPLTTW
jgi:hypothetical protein